MQTATPDVRVSAIHVLDGWNDWTERWVAYDNWLYSLTFDLTSEQVTGRTLYLRFGGLDTVANIR